MNDDSIHVGDIKSRFDDGRRYQNIDPSADEIVHDLLQLRLIHLSVCKGNPSFRHLLLKAPRHLRNVVDPVVDIVDLSASGKLSQNRLPDHLFIVFHDIGLYADAVLRCLLKYTHIPDSDETHMEGPRNRRGRKRHPRQGVQAA